MWIPISELIVFLLPFSIRLFKRAAVFIYFEGKKQKVN